MVPKGHICIRCILLGIKTTCTKYTLRSTTPITYTMKAACKADVSKSHTKYNEHDIKYLIGGSERTLILETNLFLMDNSCPNFIKEGSQISNIMNACLLEPF